MAKAQFHKNQRVYVKPVGTWALVERVVPHWAKGIDEPIRIHYDVGLGREFAAEELQSEEPASEAAPNGGQALARSFARATNGSRPRIAPAIPCPAPIRWSSPAKRNGAAGACRAPNMISIPQGWRARRA